MNSVHVQKPPRVVLVQFAWVTTRGHHDMAKRKRRVQELRDTEPNERSLRSRVSHEISVTGRSLWSLQRMRAVALDSAEALLASSQAQQLVEGAQLTNAQCQAWTACADAVRFAYGVDAARILPPARECGYFDDINPEALRYTVCPISSHVRIAPGLSNSVIDATMQLIQEAPACISAYASVRILCADSTMDQSVILVHLCERIHELEQKLCDDRASDASAHAGLSRVTRVSGFVA